MRRFTSILLPSLGLALILALAQFAVHLPAVAAETVGTVQKVQQTFYGTPPQAPRIPKHPRDAIAADESLETTAESAALIRFGDGSQLTLGAETRILVNAFVFTPGGDAKATFTVPVGAFRWVSGKIPKGATIFETPTAILKVSGTSLAVRVSPNGDTLIAVGDGEIDVTVKATGESGKVVIGQSLQVTGKGARMLPPGIAPTRDRIVDLGWPVTTDRDGGGGERGNR